MAASHAMCCASQDNPPAVLQIDDPHLCLFVDNAVRAKYADAEAAAGFAVAMTNRLTENLAMPAGTTLAVHLCRRAGGKARGEHGTIVGLAPTVSL
jgi:hypothetical protein